MPRARLKSPQGFAGTRPPRTRVLLICENELGVEAILKQQGYQVLWVPDALAGLHVCVATAVHAVVFEYDMPGLRGDEFARHLKSEKPDLPILMLTSENTRSIDAPVERVIAKESVREALLPILRDLLKRPA